MPDDLASRVQAALDGLRALLMVLPGMQSVHIGAPELGRGSDAVAWCAIAGIHGFQVDAAGRIRSVRASLSVGFAYPIGAHGAEGAEMTVIRHLMEAPALIARNSVQDTEGVAQNLNGACSELGELTTPALNLPEYGLMAGIEHRVVHLNVPVTIKL